MKSFKRKLKLNLQHIIYSNGASFLQKDYPILRFNKKHKDWKNHIVWKTKLMK